MATVAHSLEQSGSRWIISRRLDLSLVIGSGLAGYLYLLLYAAFHMPASFLWWFWSLAFDGTHIFGTASRTFFDREARTRYRRLLFGSLAFFFSLGPAMVLLGWKGYLALLVAVWAYYHVVRQHYGFMVLYKVKNHDLAPVDNAIDRLFLGVMMVFPPFHRFFMHHPEELGLPFSLARWETPAWIAVAVAGAIFMGRQLVRLIRREPANRPKYLLLASIIPLHWATFALVSWQAATPIVTIVHNLQYHAIIWFHNRNRYKAPDAAGRNGWIPAIVSRDLLAYVAIGLVFSAAYRVPGAHLQTVSNLAFGFFCGFGLTHYYLDSRIWRVRHDPGLREALALA
ncbi:MAG: hypothetical protein JO323_25525 [Acidobacteriia bacterium]|nr:hypothetical protein [Terriglobia bacterium]